MLIELNDYEDECQDSNAKFIKSPVYALTKVYDESINSNHSEATYSRDHVIHSKPNNGRGSETAHTTIHVVLV